MRRLRLLVTCFAAVLLVLARPAAGQTPTLPCGDYPAVWFSESAGVFPITGSEVRPQSYTVGPDDALFALVSYRPEPDRTWEFVELRSRSLQPLIVVHPSVEQAFVDNPDSTRRTPCVVQQISISGFESGKSYDLDLRWVDRSDPDTALTAYATQLFVRAHERFHVEITTGPVYSRVSRRTYELVSRTPEGEDAYTEIVEREGDGEGGIVAGATFRPWGYDPRGPLSAENAMFFLGLAVTDKPLENFYLGAGGGGRGFSLVGGVHAYRRDRLRAGFEGGQRDPDIAAIGDVIESGWGLALFIGAQVDLATFGRVFGGKGG